MAPRPWILEYLQGQFLHLLDCFRGRCQILIAVLGDMKIIFDAHATNLPISLEDICINVLSQLWGFQERFNDKRAEIDLVKISANSKTQGLMNSRLVRQ